MMPGIWNRGADKVTGRPPVKVEVGSDASYQWIMPRDRAKIAGKAPRGYCEAPVRRWIKKYGGVPVFNAVYVTVTSNTDEDVRIEGFNINVHQRAKPIRGRLYGCGGGDANEGISVDINFEHNPPTLEYNGDKSHISFSL